MEVKTVIFTSGKCELSCQIFKPENKNPTSALILAHAWWGINAEIVEHAKVFALLGTDSTKDYKVLLPDFYRGKVATNREDAGHYMADLDWACALEDIRASVQYLKNNENCSKVGVIGFCMGGALAFLAAGENVPGLNAAVSFYGIPNPTLTDMKRSKVVMQGHFGEFDTVVGLSSPQDYRKLQTDIEATETASLQMHIYPSGHGFMHPSYESFDSDQSKLATSRMKSFLDLHL